MGQGGEIERDTGAEVMRGNTRRSGRGDKVPYTDEEDKGCTQTRRTKVAHRAGCAAAVAAQVVQALSQA